MMLSLFLVCLASLFLVVFRLDKMDCISPAVLFCAGFLACAIGALLASDMWSYSMTIDAFLLLIIGIIVFVIFSFGCKCAIGCRALPGYSAVAANRSMLLVVSVLMLAVLVWTSVFLSERFPASSLSESINQYNHAVKFTDAGFSGFPFPLGPLRSFCGMAGYVYAFLFAQSIATGQKSDRAILLFGLALACLIQIVTASRTAAIGYIFCAVVSFFIIKQRTNGRALLTMRSLLVLMGIAIALGLTFQAIGSAVQGRVSSLSFSEFLPVYIGAQIPNFDSFVSEGGGGEADLFGYMTFRNTIHWFGTHLGISDWVYQYDLPFLSRNGLSTGNVYTTFYAFLYDFGIVGLILLTAVMAVVSELIYHKAKSEDGAASCTWVIVYSIVAYALALSFFSNKFYEGIITINMLFKLIYLLIAVLILVRRSHRNTREVQLKS